MQKNINNWQKGEKGYKNPPYNKKTVVQDFTLNENTKFVRVYDGEGSGLKGGWIMKENDISGMSPKQIQEKFALPAEPVCVGEVTIPRGSTLRMGIVERILDIKVGEFNLI